MTFPLVIAQANAADLPHFGPLYLSLWQILLLLALVTLAMVAISYYVMAAARGGDLAQEGTAGQDIYRAQLADLEQDFAEHRLDEDSYKIAKVELGRRLLRAQQDGQLAAEISVHTDGARKEAAPISKSLTLILPLAVCAGAALLFFAKTPILTDWTAKDARAAMAAPNAPSLSQEAMMVLIAEDAQKDPANPRPHILMAEILSASGRYEEALRAASAAMRRAPDNLDAKALMAEILSHLPDDKAQSDAQILLAEVLAKDPNHSGANFTKTAIAWRAAGDDVGQRQAAINAWRTYFYYLASANGQAQGREEKMVEFASRVAQQLSEIERGPQNAPMMGVNGGDPSADPTAMIATMIGRRQEKLSAHPNDLGLRISLMRVMATAQNRDGAIKLRDDGLALSGQDLFSRVVLASASSAFGLGLPNGPVSNPPKAKGQ